MAIVPDESPTSAPEADFGANDWLLEEMYEQYTADPSSVDETWAEYFKVHGAPTTDAGDGAAERQEPAPAVTRSHQPVVSRPQRQQLLRRLPRRPPRRAAQPSRPASRRTPTVEKPAPPRRSGRAPGSARRGSC